MGERAIADALDSWVVRWRSLWRPLAASALVHFALVAFLVQLALPEAPEVRIIDAQLVEPAPRPAADPPEPVRPVSPPPPPVERPPVPPRPRQPSPVRPLEAKIERPPTAPLSADARVAEGAEPPPAPEKQLPPPAAENRPPPRPEPARPSDQDVRGVAGVTPETSVVGELPGAVPGSSPTDRPGTSRGTPGGPAEPVTPPSTTTAARTSPGVTRSAIPRGGYQVQPGYPASARRQGIQGTAVLRVYVDSDGRVANVAVDQSAGHRDLDDAATDAVRRWRFEPGRRGDEPVGMWVLIPFEFRLR
jgi:periplasmic protein TonB